MAEKKLAVVITGDAKGARKAMGDVGSGADGMHSKLQSVGAGVGKVFKAAAVGAGVLAVGVGAFLKGGADSLINLERLAGQTQAVIKSTGGAAGVSAEQVSSYADSIEKATGVEAEGIIQGENMLLTFTNLKNGVGEGNDIFNQATDIMTDMSVAMGTDTSKTAVQLGKALNDPIKGISALSKVGVTFTDQQKAQIKAMVEAGDVAGAQKIILAELNKEFGGSAEAFGDTTAGKVQKLKNLFGDFQEELASRLLPVITKVADWLADKIPAASALIQAKIAELAPTFDKIAGYADDIGAAFLRFVDAARPVFEAIAGFVAKNPAPVFGALAVVVGGALLAATVAWGTALFAALSPMYLVAAAVALVAGGLIYAYQHFEGFRNVVDSVASWLTGTALPAIQSFASLVATGFGELVGWVQTHWGQIKGYIEGAINTVATIVGGVIDGLKVAWQTWGTELVSIAQTVWGYIKGTVENGINLVKGVIDVVMGLIHGDWSRAWDGLKGILGAVWDQIKLAVETGINLVKSALSIAWDAIKLVASTAWSGIKGVITGSFDAVVEFVKGLPDKISTAASGMFDGVKEAFRSAINWIIRAWNGLEFKIPGFDPPGPGPTFGGFTLGMPNIPEFHSGGAVPGGKSSEVLSMLQGGEVVLDRGTVNSLASTRGGSGGVTIVVQGTVLDGRQLGQLAAEGLNEYARTQNRPVLVGVT